MPNPLAALAFGDLGNRAAADHRQWFVLENVRIIRAARFLVLRFDQKPWLLFFPGPAVHAHEMPSPMQLLAVQGESEMTFLVARVRVALRVPAAAIPNHDGAAAILPLRDGSLEGVVFDRMIFHVDGKALLVRNETRAAGDRPALHHPVELEPQVIMQTPCGVLLDDEPISLGSMRAPPRFRGHVELALPAVYLKAHRSTRTPAFRRSTLERPCSRPLLRPAPCRFVRQTAALGLHAAAQSVHATDDIGRQLAVPVPVRTWCHTQLAPHKV